MRSLGGRGEEVPIQVKEVGVLRETIVAVGSTVIVDPQRGHGQLVLFACWVVLGIGLSFDIPADSIPQARIE